MLLAMHIPDGFLDPRVCLAAALVSLAMLGYALWRIRLREGERLVPLMGVMAACIFAAQMVNVPLVGLGASGHLLGGVLAAIVLGPLAGAVALAAVIVVQCLLFSDGGLLALGANLLNMAVIGSMGGYVLFRLLARLIGGPRGTVIAAAVAAWLTTAISALAFSVEMAAGGEVAFRHLAALMLLYHAVIGLGEAITTGMAVAWLLRVRPDVLYDAPPSDRPERSGRVLAAGLTLALALAVFAAPFASELDDGLETVAARLHFSEKADDAAIAPFPDYQLPARAGGWPVGAATSLMGFLGTVVTWGIAAAVGRGAQLARPAGETVSAL